MDRSWMYDRCHGNRMGLKRRFLDGVDYFIRTAISHEEFRLQGGIRCPCNKCRLGACLTPDEVKFHLEKRGFKPNYFIWTAHGEVGRNENAEPGYNEAGTSRNPESSTGGDETQQVDQVQGLISDALGVNQTFEDPLCDDTESYDDNESAKEFYNLLSEANKPLWQGSSESKLSVCIKLLGVKSMYKIAEQGMDAIIKLMLGTTQVNSDLPQSYYDAKRLVGKLGLALVRIDCCVNGCMLFYDNEFGLLNGALTECSVCHEPRYETCGRSKPVPRKAMFYLPIIPRLQRMFASMQTAPNMTWHFENRNNGGQLRHPSDGEAWKHFDRVHPDFADEPRNVRLGLCSDGFTPYYQMSTKAYSCWPVIVTPYNLPPNMCMSTPYMFLACVIPGPDSPVNGIDVYLQPLIDDLKRLWAGVLTYDISRKKNFTLRAALMWTINDFPAYGMLSGWGTHGKLACPICMEDTNAFTLKHGGKPSWFDSHRRFLPREHSLRRNKKEFLKGVAERRDPPRYPTSEEVWDKVRNIPKVSVNRGKIAKPVGHGTSHNWWKRSIFWDLPYWKDNLLRHNLDVMHIEKNFFDNIFNTVMNVKGKTKDNDKARKDVELYCNHPELHLFADSKGKIIKPNASYSLSANQVESVYRWITGLKMPDGYCSNLAKCANVDQKRMIGMKSHDCHIFMEFLIPIAFSTLNKEVLNPLVEVSQFFKNLCCSTLNSGDLIRMEQNMPLILCKLARIFPPGFFDSMEHLPVHLAYEAWLGGPVQYRWMYPFERFMGEAKRSVKNKARVEGSICAAYLHRETINFCSYYFNSNADLGPRIRRNEVIHDGGRHHLALSVFCLPGRLTGKKGDDWLTDQELLSAHVHVLINCTEVQPYIAAFKQQFPGSALHTNFPSWFHDTVYHEQPTPLICHLRNLSDWPSRYVKEWDTYFVNGYRFQTQALSARRATYNSGVYVEGDGGNGGNNDFYGVVQRILEISYTTLDYQKSVVLFYCVWFDQEASGTILNRKTNTVDVRMNGRYRAYDPFVMANTVRQVYYVPYPSIQTNRRGWCAAIKTKPRSRLEEVEDSQEDDAYQVDEMSNVNAEIEIEPVTRLCDDGAGGEEIADGEDENQDEEEGFGLEADDDDLVDQWEV